MGLKRPVQLHLRRDRSKDRPTKGLVRALELKVLNQQMEIEFLKANMLKLTARLAKARGERGIER